MHLLRFVKMTSNSPNPGVLQCEFSTRIQHWCCFVCHCSRLICKLDASPTTTGWLTSPCEKILSNSGLIIPSQNIVSLAVKRNHFVKNHLPKIYCELQQSLGLFFGYPDCTMNITAHTKPSRTWLIPLKDALCNDIRELKLL